jgi:MOSC domain-containing protein YiiM
MRSAIVKRPVAGAVRVEAIGLVGDQQADHRVHGGPDKAVYFYPFEHYASWLADLPRHRDILVPGGFGENVTTVGLNEHSVGVGDVLAIGSTQLQVTEPRQPCIKLATRYDDATLGKIMNDTGRTGWYARVVKPGEVKAGDEIRIVRRPNPNWSVDRFARFDRRKASIEELREFARIEDLPEACRQKVARTLADRIAG